MNRSSGFSISTVALSVLTAALASVESGGSARAVLLYGFLNAVLLTVLSTLSGLFWRSESPLCKSILAVLSLLLAAELIQTVLQAQHMAQQEFHSMALLGLLPLLLWAGWHIKPDGWNAPARVLWWFVLVGGAVCIAGLAGQMQWPNLLAAESAGGLHDPGSFFCTEFLLWPVLCPQEDPRRGACLPWAAFAVQSGAALSMSLVFGAQDYPAGELLRAWSIGAFSRMDALLILIWLTCAVYRVGFLCAALRRCVELLFRTEGRTL